MFIMPTQPPSPVPNDTPSADPKADAKALEKGSTALYRDRPTDDGMKGDGADEPNAGSPHLPKQGPSRRTHSTPGK